jgi:hypothetical protein
MKLHENNPDIRLYHKPESLGLNPFANRNIMRRKVGQIARNEGVSQ